MLSVLSEEVCYSRRRFRADSDPVVNAFAFDMQPSFMPRGHGIKVAHPFHVPPISFIAAIGDHNMIKGSLLSAAPTQPDRNHSFAKSL